MLFERKPNNKLWEQVQKFADTDENKTKAVQIIFQQHYELPEESIELIKKLASKEQPKQVKLEITKNLFQNKNIPYGMYRSLMSILAEDPDIDVKSSINKTALRQMNEFNVALMKIQPTVLSELLKQITNRQNELKKILSPFAELQNSSFTKRFAVSLPSSFIKRLEELQKSIDLVNLKSIKIPTSQIKIDDILLKDVKEAKFSTNSILSKIADEKSDLKTALESKQQIEKISETLAGIEKKLVEVIDSSSSSQNVIKNIKDDINRKLSPTTTIGVAFVVGISASFLASALFKLWTDLGDTITTIPTIVNSTIPTIVNSTIPTIVNSTIPTIVNSTIPIN